MTEFPSSIQMLTKCWPWSLEPRESRYVCQKNFFSVLLPQGLFSVMLYTTWECSVCVCVCTHDCASVRLFLVRVWVYMHSIHTVCAASDGNSTESCLLSSIEMRRINSCVTLYEFFKDLLRRGFTPSDSVCLINSSLYSCAACISKLLTFSLFIFWFNCVKIENAYIGKKKWWIICLYILVTTIICV